MIADLVMVLYAMVVILMRLALTFICIMVAALLYTLYRKITNKEHDKLLIERAIEWMNSVE